MCGEEHTAVALECGMLMCYLLDDVYIFWKQAARYWRFVILGRL
jgi:hypothetical protein